jgi:REP element-mobilizing transposase RayT
VFSTKNQKKTLVELEREKIHRFIWGVLNNKKCHLYRIGGVEDHIHIVTHVHPMVAVAHLVKDIKIASSIFIKREKILPEFTGWQNGYGAFTYAVSAKDNLIDYVKTQKEHHKKITFREEYRSLLREHQIEFDEKYLL